MNEADSIRLLHKADAAREAIAFSDGRRRTDLDSDRMLVLALMKLIEIIGEAAAQVSHETRGLLPEIPWTDVVGMRNRLVHVYFDINLDTLWQTVQADLPMLISRLDEQRTALGE